jgi:hypothetical protein
MSSLKEFVAGTIVDALLPLLRRSLTDVVVEVLDERKTPNRTEYQEVRNVVDELRGKLNRAARKPADTDDLKGLATRLDELEARLQAVEGDS